MEAVSNNGSSLEYASNSLRNNKNNPDGDMKKHVK